MKKVFLTAFLAMSMVAMAQHVTPLAIEIAEVRLDSLRTLYFSEPTMYRASLDVVAQNLSKNAEELKVAKNELKVEQAHAKEMDKSIKNGIKMCAALKKLYQKEESELKSMQKTIEAQQKTLNKHKELNQETRENYVNLLERQQKELGYSIREVADRQRTISELETTIQNKQTSLQAYLLETQQKATDISVLESQLKERVATVKAEQKTAKSMQ